jgi:hypothetical protein
MARRVGAGLIKPQPPQDNGALAFGLGLVLAFVLLVANMVWPLPSGAEMSNSEGRIWSVSVWLRDRFILPQANSELGSGMVKSVLAARGDVGFSSTGANLAVLEEGGA